MDWNVTARLRAPFIKVFEEERELTVVLLVDVSGSRFFGSASKMKKDLMAEVAAVLSFSASINNDKVGALFFSSKVEKFIPPKKGRSHLLRIIRELIEFEPKERGTDIGEALRFLTNAIKKKCTAFLLSDLLDVDSTGHPKYEDALKVAVNRHDISAINIYDPREKDIPDVGLLNIMDGETGEQMWVDTSDRKLRQHFKEWNDSVYEQAITTLRKYKVDCVSIRTDEDYVKGLVSLFKSRG